jgi:hypothetical protein
MLKLPFSALALLSLSAALPAATLTDQSAFVAQLTPGYSLETFDSLTYGLHDALTFGNGTYSYTVTSTATDYQPLWAGSLNSDPFLGAAGQATAALVLTFTSPVTAVGGYFFMTDSDDNLVTGTLTLNLSDGTTVELTDPPATTFRGFTSSTPITSLTIQGTNYASMDDLYVGSAAAGTATPEPASLLLAAAGALGLALVKFRRA